MSATTILATATLLGAVLATGMVAGLVFSFAHSVMPGLRTLDDRGFLTAFQRIDLAIANPWMGVTFLGSPVLTLAALLLHLPDGGETLPWLALALLLIALTVGLTVVIHLPLNRAVQESAPAMLDAAGLRARFEDRWMPWNVVRTVTSVGSLAALCWALFQAGSAS
ncbi:DUF1772 domain-containing protein [Nocardioides insulae]|uniref:anthrone oxygenase family protein n=1 Tax=Nocardioides insulae TaxID=394734 RepID=UPI00048E2E9E|nr:anthrone oxygenase family protein [Nocardioides insulae]